MKVFIKKRERTTREERKGEGERERKVNNDWLYMKRKSRELFNYSLFVSFFLSIDESLRIFVTLRC